MTNFYAKGKDITFLMFPIGNETYPRTPLIIWFYKVWLTCRLLIEVHVSTSFSKSKRAPTFLPLFYLFLSLHFLLLSLIKPARLTIQIHSAQGEETEEIQMFLSKNYLDFFLLKGTSHGCCCFPQTYLFLAECSWSLSTTSTFSSVLWHYPSNSLPLQQQSQHSSSRVTGT